jgi:hypothetical protein
MHFDLSPRDVLYLAGTCESCYSEFDTNWKSLRDSDVQHAGTCALCAKSYCSDCQFHCDCCAKTVCSNCAKPCVGCRERACSPCLDSSGRCAYCSDDLRAQVAAIDSVTSFSNACWFCVSAALLGAAVGYAWMLVRGGVQ